MISRKDFFQTINNFPHSLAVYLTFTLDKEVIDKIAENSDGNIIILHDYRQGVSLKNNWNSRVVCIPVNTYKQHQQNYFHSKLALLKSDEGAKLLLGSANLSKNSFSNEKEMCFETQELKFDSELYNNVIDYIESLIPQTHTSTDVLQQAIKILRLANDQTKKQSALTFIYHPQKNEKENMEDTSFSERVSNQLHTDEQPVLKIASPFLSADFKTELTDFIKRINPKEIQLYLRNNYPLPNEFKSLTDLKIFQPKLKTTRDGFHAKLISIEYLNWQIVFVSSANFSRQGFFLNLEQGANQECGVIISSNPINKKYLLEDWFNEGWQKPQTINEWIKTEDENLKNLPEEIFNVKPYVTAEKIKNTKTVKLFFYIAKVELLNEVYADGNKLNLIPENIELSLFQCNYNFKGETVHIKIGNEFDELVTIFDGDIFENNILKYEDLFMISNDRMDNISYEEMSKEIETNGIRILGNKVIEPPKLEQFYNIVKNNVKFIEMKNQFNEFHFERLKLKLDENENAEGVYVATQLYKIFTKKKFYKFSDACLDRIRIILNQNASLKIDFETYSSFLKKWATL